MGLTRLLCGEVLLQNEENQNYSPYVLHRFFFLDRPESSTRMADVESVSACDCHDGVYELVIEEPVALAVLRLHELSVELIKISLSFRSLANA